MANPSDRLTETLKRFIEAQPCFFVATAAAQGRVNLSPKGLDSLRILSDRRIAWLNLTGSGNETAAHVRASRRMTLMFCAFEGEARILRLYGEATVLHPRDAAWPDLIGLFPEMAGSRQIFLMDIDRVQSSCGAGVPVMAFRAQRGLDELLPFYEQKGPEGVRDYWARRNARSIDDTETGI